MAMCDLSCPRPERRVRALIVRHGETEWNAIGRMQGASDIPLSSAGIRQATALAHRLEGERIDAVYSSDLSRAVETARIVAGAYRPSLRQLRALRETMLGDWEGLTVEDITARGEGELYEAYRSDSWRVRPPNGERLEQVAERMTSAMDEIVKSHAGQTILVVGHGGSLRALFCQALGVPARAMLGFRLHNASLSVVEYGPQRASLALVNDVSHVPEPCHGAEPATDGKTGRLRR